MKVLVILLAVIAACRADPVIRSDVRSHAASDVSCYENTDCGFNIGEPQALDAISCREACDRNPSCRGWVTYEGFETPQCSMKYAGCLSAQRSTRSGATLCEKPGEWPRCYRDTDCAGWDFDISNQPMDPMQCRAECMSRPSCRGWLSYHRDGHVRCWLKTHACTTDQMSPLEDATWCERGPKCYENTDCAGYDFEIANQPMSASSCADACKINPICRGWLAYVREGTMHCWMKYYACSAEQRTSLQGATWCEKPEAQDLALQCYRNTDCAGFDFAISNRPIDVKSCLEACARNDQCRGWLTYYRNGAKRCWLKNYACDESERSVLRDATWCEKPRYDPGPKCYRNTDCQGHDYALSAEPMTSEACQNACLDRSDCKGWITFHREGELRCWLKNHNCNSDERSVLQGATWCERGPLCYQNTDCLGYDFAISNEPMLPADCARECEDNRSCRGWLVYYRDGAVRCWLKNHACTAAQRSVLEEATWCVKP